MKIYFKHPSGWAFLLEWKPMELDKFRMLCYLAAGALAVYAITVFITTVAGR